MIKSIKKEDNLNRVLKKSIIYTIVAYMVLTILFLHISNATEKIIIQQMHEFSEMYIEQIDQEMESINVELFYTLLQNRNIQSLPGEIEATEAQWYPLLNSIVDINQNMKLRYGSKYSFYVYDKESGLLILNDYIYFKDTAGKSEMAEALINKQYNPDKNEWDYFEADNVDYVFSSYEYDGTVIGYVLNIQSFLETISLKNSGYKIVPCLFTNERTISLENAETKGLFTNDQVYSYDIARLGELQLTIQPDNSLNAQLWRMQSVILIGLFCTVLLIMFSIRKLQNLQNILYQKKIAEQRMETEYLKEQIRPHFFMNCLNLIHSMAEQASNTQIAYTVSVLSNYIQYMFKDSRALRYVEEETDHVEKYIEICHLRYGDIFEFECLVDEEAKKEKIPALLLQTFVENSIKHALSMEERISISLYATLEWHSEKNMLYVCISDTGKGFKQSVLNAVANGEPVIYDGREHIGIRNAIQRLRVIYQDEAEIKLSNMADNYGAVVEIYLPAGGGVNESFDR